MGASARIIRVVNDTFTVEFEVEAEDTKKLMEELNKDELGKRLFTLLDDSLDGVEPRISKSIITLQNEQDEKIKDTGRKEVYEKAKKFGLDLEKLLSSAEVKSTSTPAQDATPDPQPAINEGYNGDYNEGQTGIPL